MIITTGKSFKWHCKRCLNILCRSLKTFSATEGQLRASALTYYTLFALVPVLALLFGIAKGFDLENWMKNVMLAKAPQHSDMLNWLFGFAEKTLQHTRGGVIAGVGALILFWSVIKMVGNVEAAVNRVWQVQKTRTIFRKFTDYLSFMIVVPLLLMIASSVTLMLGRMLVKLTESGILGTLSSRIIDFGIHCLPYLVVWVLLTFVYLFLPNTRVQFKAALFGGVIAGTLYQLLQAGYFFVQLALSKYNAIYGSFSALPLFLVWSYMNWLTVLFGVTLSYLYQNYDYESELARDRERSDAEKRLIALIFTAMVTKAFADDDKLLTAEDLAQRTNLSGTLAIEVLNTLEKRKILVALADSEYANARYMPALPLNKMTIINVLERYDKHENSSSFAIVNQPCAKKALEIMFKMRQTLANSDAQRHITDMLVEEESAEQPATTSPA